MEKHIDDFEFDFADKEILIPFGKYKGQNLYNFYDDGDSYSDYFEWLVENCEDTLNKYPDFKITLYDFIGKEIPKELPYTDNSRSGPCDIESDGILINDLKDYKRFICKLNSVFSFIGTPTEQFYRAYGEPKSYPFVLTLRKNYFSMYDGIHFHKVYIKDIPSFYNFNESWFE